MNKERQLSSKDTINSTVEVYLSEISKSRSLVYLSVSLLIVGAVSFLPFTSIPISVKSSALIRPASEITTIRSLVNGHLKEAQIVENLPVRKGDTLYILQSEILEEKETYLKNRIEKISIVTTDLQNILQPTPQPKLLNSPLIVQSWANYNQKLADATTRYKKAKTDFNRNSKLHQQKVIADTEMENVQFELDKAANELELLKQNQLNQWQSELRNHEQELRDFQSQLAQTLKEKEHLTIKASVSGTIQNLAGVYAGSVVFANQDLAQISPDTSLIVESYVKPNDIGLLKADMNVRFQIDAFNYNQWGLAIGKVLSISNDVHIINDVPVFKVKCSIDKDYLQLKNGYKGYLKKGMTLQARFMVTERTLWQLLYDNVDDWLNPNTFTN